METDSKPSKPISVIITGGLGCVGIATTSALLARFPDARVHVLDISTPNEPSSTSGLTDTTDERFNKSVAEYHRGDVTDYDSILGIFQAVMPRAVIHTAALIPNAARKLGVGDGGVTEVNVGGTKNVLRAAKQVGSVEALIYTSSCDVVKRNSWKDVVNVTEFDGDLDGDEPYEDKYSETKAIAERLVLAVASPSDESSPPEPVLKTCALRANAVVGRFDRNIVPMIAQVPRSVSIGPGTNLYDFTGVDNFASAHVLALENLLFNHSPSANGKAFYITDAQPRPFRQIMEMIWTEVDRVTTNPKDTPTDTISSKDTPRKTNEPDAAKQQVRIPFYTLPVWLVYSMVWVIARTLWLFGRASPISLSEVGDSAGTRYFDTTRAKTILGYGPKVPLRQSIRDACESYKKSLLTEKQGAKT